MEMKVTKELYDKLILLRSAELDPKGHELLNPKPMFLECGLEAPLTLQQRIQRILKRELSAQAEMQGRETFEESNDFDVSDDFDSPEIQSKYDLVEEEFPSDIAQPPAEDPEGTPPPPSPEDPVEPSPESGEVKTE